MLTVTVDSKLVTDELAKLQKRMADLRPAMDEIGQELNSRISARFETRTDPLGHAWAPWAKSTEKSYPKDGRGLVLQRHGAMLKSLTFSADTTNVRVGFSAVANTRCYGCLPAHGQEHEITERHEHEQPFIKKQSLEQSRWIL